MCNRAGNPVAEQKTPVVDGKLDARMIEADQILYPHRAIEHMPQVGLGQHMVARQPHEPSVAVVIGPAVADMKDIRPAAPQDCVGEGRRHSLQPWVRLFPLQHPPVYPLPRPPARCGPRVWVGWGWV